MARIAVVRRLGIVMSRWAWLTTYLTVHVLVAFLAAASGLVALAELADEVAGGHAIAVFDEAFTGALRVSTEIVTPLRARIPSMTGTTRSSS